MSRLNDQTHLTLMLSWGASVHHSPVLMIGSDYAHLWENRREDSQGQINKKTVVDWTICNALFLHKTPWRRQMWCTYSLCIWWLLLYWQLNVSRLWLNMQTHDNDSEIHLISGQGKVSKETDLFAVILQSTANEEHVCHRNFWQSNSAFNLLSPQDISIFLTPCKQWQ